jgi:DNA-binding response OmpR family regulator
MPGRRILLVEDDPSIRGFAREFLRADGHTVVEAGGAEEGRRLALQAAPPFELLVVDVSLPDGDGGKLAQDLAQGPGTPKVVVMSGFSPSLLKEEGASSTGFHFLQKPFRPADLRAAIAKVFAEAPGAPPAG